MTDAEVQQQALGLARAAVDGKAEDLLLLEVASLTTLADYFIICNGSSDRQIRAIADRVEEAAKEMGATLHHREGVEEARWALLDYGDVVVHIFDAATREYYRLEELWADAPRLPVSLAA